MRTDEPEEGAILVLVLVIVTVLALATAAVAQLAFTGPQAGAAVADRQRTVASLDVGVRAVAETLRSGGACSDRTVAVDAQTDVRVACTGTGPFTLTATGYLEQRACGTGRTSASPVLTATVTVTPQQTTTLSAAQLTTGPSCEREPA